MESVKDLIVLGALWTTKSMERLRRRSYVSTRIDRRQRLAQPLVTRAIVILLLLSVAGITQVATMTTYVNKDLGITLAYPATYRMTRMPCPHAPNRAFKGRQCLLYLGTGAGQKHGNIEVVIDRRKFSLGTLESAYAHTGWDKPDTIRIGKCTFYYYGVGGGGVSYPDDYFYNLYGQILLVSFDGPYPPDDKTPSKQTKMMERKVLESLRLAKPSEQENWGRKRTGRRNP